MRISHVGTQNQPFSGTEDHSWPLAPDMNYQCPRTHNQYQKGLERSLSLLLGRNQWSGRFYNVFRSSFQFTVVSIIWSTNEVAIYNTKYPPQFISFLNQSSTESEVVKRPEENFERTIDIFRLPPSTTHQLLTPSFGTHPDFVLSHQSVSTVVTFWALLSGYGRRFVVGWQCLTPFCRWCDCLSKFGVQLSEKTVEVCLLYMN